LLGVFFGFGGSDQKCISWVKWEIVCKPMKEGGLEIKDIQKFNHTLLVKWKWRLLIEEKGKWKDILVSKYDNKTRRNQVFTKYHSSWWPDLNKVCGEDEGDGWVHEKIA